MAAMAEVCAIHFVARRNAQNARSALCTAGSAHCSDVAALGWSPALQKAAWLATMLQLCAPSRRPVAMCACVEPQDAEAVRAAAEQWPRRLVQLVLGALRARVLQSEVGIVVMVMVFGEGNHMTQETQQKAHAAGDDTA